MATTAVIRPAAVLPEQAALAIVRALEDRDVSRGGLWNATSGLWQRFDRSWDMLEGHRGRAELIGTICVSYDTPTRFHITVYRVTVTEHGAALGWTVTRLCDEAFGFAGLTLASCPRAELPGATPADPFFAQRTAVRSALPRQSLPLSERAARSSAGGLLG